MSPLAQVPLFLGRAHAGAHELASMERHQKHTGSEDALINEAHCRRPVCACMTGVVLSGVQGIANSTTCAPGRCPSSCRGHHTSPIRDEFLLETEAPVRCRPHTARQLPAPLTLLVLPWAALPSSRSCTPPQFIGSGLAYRTGYREQLVRKRRVGRTNVVSYSYLHYQEGWC